MIMMAAKRKKKPAPVLSPELTSVVNDAFAKVGSGQMTPDDASDLIAAAFEGVGDDLNWGGQLIEDLYAVSDGYAPADKAAARFSKMVARHMASGKQMDRKV